MLVRSGVAIWGLAFTLTILGLAASGETRNSVPAGWSFTLPAGDPVAGGFAFAKMGCPSCHRVAGRTFRQMGAEGIAPEFDAARARLPREYLAESILDPPKVIADGEDRYRARDGGSSRMRDYAEVMTLRELLDVVAYLGSVRG
jgi:hypothetical protein